MYICVQEGNIWEVQQQDNQRKHSSHNNVGHQRRRRQECQALREMHMLTTKMQQHIHDTATHSWRQDVWESATGLRDKNPIGFGSKTNKNIRTGTYLVYTENQQKRRNGNGVALNTEPIQNMLSVDARAGTRRWAHRRAHQQSETGRHHNRDVVSECKMVMSSRDVDL